MGIPGWVCRHLLNTSVIATALSSELEFGAGVVLISEKKSSTLFRDEIRNIFTTKKLF